MMLKFLSKASPISNSPSNRKRRDTPSREIYVDKPTGRTPEASEQLLEAQCDTSQVRYLPREKRCDRSLYKIAELHWIQAVCFGNEDPKHYSFFLDVLHGNVKVALPKDKADIINEVGLAIAFRLVELATGTGSKWDHQMKCQALEIDHLHQQANLAKMDPRARGLLFLTLTESKLNKTWKDANDSKCAFLEPSLPNIKGWLDAAEEMMKTTPAPKTCKELFDLVIEKDSRLAAGWVPKPILGPDLNGKLRKLYEDQKKQQEMLKPKSDTTRKKSSTKHLPKAAAKPGQQVIKLQKSWLHEFGDVVGIPMPDDSIKIMSEDQGQNFLKRVKDLSEEQLDAVWRIMSAKSRGIKIVLLIAGPAAGKTEVLVLACIGVVLMKGITGKRPVLFLSAMLAAVLTFKERYEAFALDSGVDLKCNASFKNPDKIEAARDPNLEDIKSRTKYQTMNAYSYGKLGNELKFKGLDYIYNKEENNEAQREQAKEQQRLRRLREMGVEFDKITGTYISEMANADEDVELVKAIQALNQVDPSINKEFERLEECMPEHLLDYYKPRHSLDEQFNPRDEMRDAGRLFLRLHDAASGHLEPFKSMSPDDDSIKSVMKAIQQQAALMKLHLEEGMPTDSRRPRTKWSDNPDNSDKVVAYAREVLKQLITELQVSLPPKDVKRACAMLRLRFEAMQVVPNNARFEQAIDGVFPFEPAYSDYITDEKVAHLGISASKMCRALGIFDKTQIRDRKITGAMMDYACYTSISIRRSKKFHGRDLRCFDEAQTTTKYMLNAVLRCAEDMTDEVPIVLCGQPEQSTMQFAGGCGSFDEYITNKISNRLLVERVELSRNYASTNEIVQIYNHTVTRCNTENPVIMTSQPSAPKPLNLPVIVYNTLDSTKRDANKDEKGRRRKHLEVLKTPYDVQQAKQVADRVLFLAINHQITKIAILTRNNFQSRLIENKVAARFRDYNNDGDTWIKEPTVDVLTLHKSISKRYDHVIIVGITSVHFNDGRHEFNKSQQEIDELKLHVYEETKVFLVGISRPRLGLTVLYNQYRPASNDAFTDMVDEFVKDGLAKVQDYRKHQSRSRPSCSTDTLGLHGDSTEFQRKRQRLDQEDREADDGFL